MFVLIADTISLMAQNKEQNASGERTKKSLRSKVGWILLICIIISVVIWYFLVPFIVKKMIQNYLRQRWDGPVEVKRLEINLFSSSRRQSKACHCR